MEISPEMLCSIIGATGAVVVSGTIAAVKVMRKRGTAGGEPGGGAAHAIADEVVQALTVQRQHEEEKMVENVRARLHALASDVNGDRLKVTIDPALVHLFDPETGKRI